MTRDKQATQDAHVESDGLVAFRRGLHRFPEVAHREHRTAQAVRTFLADHGLEPLAEGIAGTGLLYRVDGSGPGRRLLLRGDLDGLPLAEDTGAAYAASEGHHACGHDGHIAMLAGALARLHTERDWNGTVYGLFQPAEETGEGAALVLRDERVAALEVDHAFAIHNLPGQALGSVHVRAGPMAVASVGLHVHFEGKTTHAGTPQEGRNAVPALAALVQDAMGAGDGQNAFITPIHIESGRIAYGTAAGSGDVRFTLRAADDDTVAALEADLRRQAKQHAEAHGLGLRIETVEPFAATHNDAEAVARVQKAAADAELPVEEPPGPQPWSEDVGVLLKRWPGALIGLGSGTEQAPLHTARYDFPDALLPLGVRFWCALVRAHLEAAP